VIRGIKWLTWSLGSRVEFDVEGVRHQEMCHQVAFCTEEGHHHIRVRYYNIFLRRLSTSIIPRIVTSRPSYIILRPPRWHAAATTRIVRKRNDAALSRKAHRSLARFAAWRKKSMPRKRLKSNRKAPTARTRPIESMRYAIT